MDLLCKKIFVDDSPFRIKLMLPTDAEFLQFSQIFLWMYFSLIFQPYDFSNNSMKILKPHVGYASCVTWFHENLFKNVFVIQKFSLIEIQTHFTDNARYVHFYDQICWVFLIISHKTRPAVIARICRLSR